MLAWNNIRIAPVRSPVFSAKDLNSFFDEFDQTLQRSFRLWDETFDHKLDRSQFFYPYNVKTRKNSAGVTEAVVFEFALAGFTADQISAKLTGNLLTVHAERKTTSQDEYLYKGISENTSIGRFAIARDVDTKAMVAKFENGVLTVTLPLKAEVVERNTEKKIEIQ